jgi:hypothetical protein
MSELNQQHPDQDGLRLGRRPTRDAADDLEGPPPLHGDGSKLSNGFLFGLHARQVLADLNAVARGRRPAAWPFGLGADAVEAHAWLASPREDRDAVAASVRAKLERFGEAEVDRHLTPRERGFAVASTVDGIIQSHLPGDKHEYSVAVTAFAQDEWFAEDGRIVGPPLTDQAVAFTLSLRKITDQEWEWAQKEKRGHPFLRTRRVTQLPTRSAMQGTPKQVAWATDLLRERRPRIEAYVARRKVDPSVDPELRDCYQATLTIVDDAPARWWIDNRNKAVAEVIDQEARKIAQRRRLTRGRSA